MLDETNGTLTFKHDTKKPAGAYQLNSSDEVPGWSVKEDGDGNVIINSIEKVVFDASFADARPTSCHCWFKECYDLKAIEGIEHLNTENVTDMKSMFNGCGNLTELDVSNLDTRNVTDMADMFHGCYGLTELNLSSFDTRNVTNMGYMFYTCYKLNTLNLSNFDTQNVTDMSSMFYDCNSLTAIYVGDKFVTTACGASEQMFSGCKKLVGAVPYDASKTDKEMANYTTGYFTDIKTTGIDATTASGNIAAKYYDMQGRRMDAPQKGLNIVKRGDRTMKVLVK